jgi:flagellar hook-length control protein FliK
MAAHQAAGDAPAGAKSAVVFDMAAVLLPDAAAASDEASGGGNESGIAASAASDVVIDPVSTAVLDLPGATDAAAPVPVSTAAAPAVADAVEAKPAAIVHDPLKHSDVLRRMVASLLAHSLLDENHTLDISGEGRIARFIQGNFPTDTEIDDDDPRPTKSHDDDWAAEIVADLTAQLLAAQVKADAPNDPSTEKAKEAKADDKGKKDDTTIAVDSAAATTVTPAASLAVPVVTPAVVTSSSTPVVADRSTPSTTPGSPLSIEAKETAVVSEDSGVDGSRAAVQTAELPNPEPAKLDPAKDAGERVAVPSASRLPIDNARPPSAPLKAAIKEAVSSLNDGKLQQLVQRALSRQGAPSSVMAATPAADETPAANAASSTTASASAREIVHAVKSEIAKTLRRQDSASVEIAKSKPTDDVPARAERPVAEPAPADAPSFTAATRAVVARDSREVPTTAVALADLSSRFKGMPVSLPVTAAVAAPVRALPQFETSGGSAGQQGFGRAHEPAATVSKRLAQTVETVTGFEAMLMAPATLTSSGLSSSTSSTSSTGNIPNAPEVMDSIVQSMRMQYRDGIGTAVITLDPEFLGGVAISIHVANGAVTATLQADNPQVRAWLEANEPMLRQGLESQGLTLDRLVVAKESPRDDAPSADDHRRQQQPEPEDKPRPRRHETATFEVIV